MTNDFAGRPHGDGPVPADRMEELGRLLERETALAVELRNALERQRAGVADNDQAGISAGTDRIAELVTSLQEARIHRRRLLADLGGDAATPLARLESTLRAPLPATVDRARARLAEAADEAGRELAINRTVLVRALENGEAFLSAVMGVLGRETPSYDRNRVGTRASRTAVLVNKVG